MYKLFIVDDEYSARNGLKECFDWKKYGIEVVGLADDGENAIPVILQVKPEIVITDVKMPNMNGIQLSLKLREMLKGIKIIFISGYDDVEYLKSALKVDAIDYILKPINLDELANTIHRVVKLIADEEKQKNRIYMMETKLMQSMPLLREKFFAALIRNELFNVDSLQKKIEFLELNLPIEGFFCALTIHIDDHVAVFESMNEKEKELTSFSILNICQELIDTYLHGYVFENKRGEYACILLLNLEEEEDKLFSLLNDIKEKLELYLKLSITIGVGKIVDHITKLACSYAMAFDAASQRLFLGKSRIITISNLETGTEPVLRFDAVNEEKLVSVVKSANKEKVEQLLGEIFKELSFNRRVGIKYCQNICLQLLLITSRMLVELEIQNRDIADAEMILWEQLFTFETLEDMKNRLTAYLKLVCNAIMDKKNSKSNNLIEQIKNIIQKRYHENLTINEIASQVYLTSTYVCLIFKQETGETINDYLTRVRIEKAKEMLKDYKNKFYDICYAVGYADPSYFSKLFKKYTGLSPLEFRKAL